MTRLVLDTGDCRTIAWCWRQELAFLDNNDTKYPINITIVAVTVS